MWLVRRGDHMQLNSVELTMWQDQIRIFVLNLLAKLFY